MTYAELAAKDETAKAFAQNPPANVKFTRFASGLHEVLGLAQRDGWLYAMQRCELTKLKDTDGDGRADVFKTVCDLWSISGDYHEYAFGSKFDKDGNLWAVLCLTGSFTSNVPFRGWCVRITPEGKMIPTCSELRTVGSLNFLTPKSTRPRNELSTISRSSTGRSKLSPSV